MTAILSALAIIVAATAFIATPATAAQVGQYVATVRVDGGDGSQYFRVHLVEVADITAAFDNLNKKTDTHPNGLVVRTGPEYNVGYSWHIDPNDVAFVDFSTEVCDGLPSDVESGAITSDRYCPWSSRVVAMTPIVV